MKKFNKYTVIGVMSGTSLDGIDICKCYFNKDKNWTYRIENGVTIKYSKKWIKTLNSLHTRDEKFINKINIEYAKLIGNEINKFLEDNNSDIDFVASHGHTIFHQPENKITLQIGDGQTIANTTNLKTISNFRKLDVELNGQGAPLVPIGDLYLFKDYKYCLNLGGFSNLSIKKDNGIIAYDICPVNIILNYLSKKINLDYDKDGKIGKSGSINLDLLHKLNQIDYYKKPYPKSLSREWLENEILNLDELKTLYIKDLLATFYEHIGYQIGKKLKDNPVYISGGGAKNKYLIHRIKKYSKSKIIIADQLNIDFKEAIIFGFLGVLKNRNEINCLKDVTGADRDSSSGEICYPK
mgnify:FL=1